MPNKLISDRNNLHANDITTTTVANHTLQYFVWAGEKFASSLSDLSRVSR